MYSDISELILKLILFSKRKHVKPKPYEVCRREFPEIRFSRKELCVSDDNIGGFIFEPGSPLLCNDYLTGIKLFSQRLPRKKNFTLHIYIRMAQLINWFIEENIEDSPNWVSFFLNCLTTMKPLAFRTH